MYHFKGMSRRIMKPFWDLQVSPGAETRHFRRTQIAFLNFRFALQRGLYKRRLKRDTRRFNCQDQDESAWIDRAEIASTFIAAARADLATEAISVADLGCGDQKLFRVLSRNAVPTVYQGYDLFPQAPEVQKFDIDTDHLTNQYHVAVLLGVLEYSADIVGALSRLRPFAKHLVVSHAVSDLRKVSPSRRRNLKWISHLSKDEFERCLSDAGFEIVDEKITANKRSLVWQCR